MKKKNIGFILFGVAGADLLFVILAAFLIFPLIYDRTGVPQTVIIDRIALIIGLVSALIVIIVGVILLIKFRNEE